MTCLQVQIRDHIDLLTPSAKAKKNTVSAADLRAFNPRRAQCCTTSNFRFNLEGTPCDDWNNSATRVFVNDFFRTHPEYKANNRVVRAMVQLKTASAIKHLIRCYRLRNVAEMELEAARRQRARRERKRLVGIPPDFRCSGRDPDAYYPAIPPSP